jgi:mannose-6-phosphate isomerase-like protein (cupin superfamily)
MIPSSRLRIAVDLDGLLRDLAGLPADAWVLHFNTREYVGDWSGIALRSVGGDPRRLYPDLAHHRPYEDTPLLARCPAVAAVLRELACVTTAVRFLRLGAGAQIREHRDDIGWDTGEVRLHIPVVTTGDVDFVVDGQVLPMRAGECWYADLTQPHRVDNRGVSERIHLVIDCRLDDDLATLIQARAEPAPLLCTEV